MQPATNADSTTHFEKSVHHSDRLYRLAEVIDWLQIRSGRDQYQETDLSTDLRSKSMLMMRVTDG